MYGTVFAFCSGGFPALRGQYTNDKVQPPISAELWRRGLPKSVVRGRQISASRAVPEANSLAPHSINPTRPADNSHPQDVLLLRLQQRRRRRGRRPRTRPAPHRDARRARLPGECSRSFAILFLNVQTLSNRSIDSALWFLPLIEWPTMLSAESLEGMLPIDQDETELRKTPSVKVRTSCLDATMASQSKGWS